MGGIAHAACAAPVRPDVVQNPGTAGHRIRAEGDIVEPQSLKDPRRDVVVRTGRVAAERRGLVIHELEPRRVGP